MFAEIDSLLIYSHFTSDLADNACLSARELELTKGFSNLRVSHFCTGRFAAKEALKKFTSEQIEILAGSDGEPIWPIGFVGSISHNEALIGAVVSNNPQVKSLGLDIEKIGRVKREMWDLCFTKNEQTYLSALSQAELEFHTTLFFSLKESFYKMQYPITHFKFWFTDVELKLIEGSIQLKVLLDHPELTSIAAAVAFTHSTSKNCVVTCCYPSTAG